MVDFTMDIVKRFHPDMSPETEKTVRDALEAHEAKSGRIIKIVVSDSIQTRDGAA